MHEPDPDLHIRLKAFEHVRALERRFKSLKWSRIEAGFDFEGERIHLATRAKGIFKPRQMSTLLSIKTVIPRVGRKFWYDDQHQANQAAFEERDHFPYAFEGGGPKAHGNALMRHAWEKEIPIIYFFPLAPGRYQPIVPAFINGWDPVAAECRVCPGNLALGSPTIDQKLPSLSESEVERRYSMRLTRQRLHQSLFRQAVLDAYDGQCAISGLPERSLLDAAHIVEDRNEKLGQPTVQNGLPLSKIHHTAYDSDLIGIDPDYRVHVSERLLELHDGPMLDALKGVDGSRIRLPGRPEDNPDPQRLEHRFERFRAAA
ncbi:MAG: HNH endonuclease [Bryobacterales bacterium]|nr:HNH endonuclease [Bryobacterales bacterium]